MSLIESKGSMSGAAKELKRCWQNAQAVWNDAQSQEFEQRFIIPLEQDVRSALEALDMMHQVLQKVENDCE